MKRAVVTLVRKEGDPFLDECIQSVKASGNPHIIIECGSEWGQVLYEMRNVAESIAWVDSDDYVYPEVMNRAFELMERTQVGVVYTDEEVRENGRLILKKDRDFTVDELRKKPFTMHHLIITRKNTVSDRAKKCIDQMDSIYDWPIRLDAAVNYGAARLPEFGYVWRRHPNQETRTLNDRKTSTDVVRKEYAL